MNTYDLLKRLRREATPFRIEDIEARLFAVRKTQAENTLPLHKLLIYNYESFLALQRAIPNGTPMPVNEKKLREMETELDNYMTMHLPGDENYKAFIRIVSVYLTFIARKPLHPPGMLNENGQAIYRDGIAVCSLRIEEITKPSSLCRFCVSTI
ncbi:MAG: DUF2115 domain-containing protein [Clostridiales bacterium]|jgi:uncharacterized protein (UPF0305 family)|nr:DUF2115 domain-containing protein [Clostridiales bacterium]